MSPRLLLPALFLLRASAPGLAAEGDVPWFEAHPRERLTTLQACRDDERLARDAICANAERAQDRVEARVRTQPNRAAPSVESILIDPNYWAANRVARAGALAECAAGLMPAAQCAAVRAGEAIDGAGGKRRGT